MNQIYSLRYGTVPVVRATGGLDDTMQNYDPKTQQGTGFKFEAYDGRALLGCVRAALKPTGIRRCGSDAEQRHGQGFFVEGFGGGICHTI